VSTNGKEETTDWSLIFFSEMVLFLLSLFSRLLLRDGSSIVR